MKPLRDRAFLSAAVLAAALAASLGTPPPASAQGLDAEGAREAIIDAPIATGEKPVGEEEQRIAQAIGMSADNAAEIRRRFNIGRMDIVFVPGLADPDSPLADTISESADDIAALRREIEGSAIFYHAIDSQRILLRDVVAIEFGADEDVTVFVAAPAGG